jgi:putative phosphoesterase
MKILIASDSHRMTANLLTAIDCEKPDMLIHLGDIEDDPNPVAAAAGSPETPCIFIKGNCDYNSSGSVLIRRSVFTLHGHRFYCCHGHHERVNQGLTTIAVAASDEKCDIALFGHTHVPYDSEGEFAGEYSRYYLEAWPGCAPGVRIMNPGSISLPRGGSFKSYIIMSIDENDRISAELKAL